MEPDRKQQKKKECREALPEGEVPQRRSIKGFLRGSGAVCLELTTASFPGRIRFATSLEKQRIILILGPARIWKDRGAASRVSGNGKRAQNSPFGKTPFFKISS